MALNLKKVREMTLIPDNTGLSLGSVVVSYEVGSTDDADLSNVKSEEKTLTGQDLTDAQDIWDMLKNKVLSDEGL